MQAVSSPRGALTITKPNVLIPQLGKLRQGAMGWLVQDLTQSPRDSHPQQSLSCTLELSAEGN